MTLSAPSSASLTVFSPSVARYDAEAYSWRTGLTGADIYRQLPPVAPALLPSAATLTSASEEPAA